MKNKIIISETNFLLWLNTKYIYTIADRFSHLCPEIGLEYIPYESMCSNGEWMLPFKIIDEKKCAEFLLRYT